MGDLSGYLHLRFPNGRQTGEQWRVNCPVCHHDNDKAFIHMDDGKAICFHCGWKVAGWVGLIATCEGLSGRAEIARWISEHRQDLAAPYQSSLRYRPAKTQMAAQLPWDADPIEQDDAFCAYLERRGLSYIHAMLFDMRRCTESRYRNRIVVPIVENGELIYFFDRSIDPSAERKTLGVGTHDAYWPVKKSTVLFNMDYARNFVDNGGRRVVIAEGIFSALSMGTENVVATLGKTVSDAQIHKIVHIGAVEVDICFDPDAREATIRLAEALSAYGIQVFIRDFTLGDPNDYLVNRWPMPEPFEYTLSYRLQHMMGRR